MKVLKQSRIETILENAANFKKILHDGPYGMYKIRNGESKMITKSDSEFYTNVKNINNLNVAYELSSYDISNMDELLCKYILVPGIEEKAVFIAISDTSKGPFSNIIIGCIIDRKYNLNIITSYYDVKLSNLIINELFKYLNSTPYTFNHTDQSEDCINFIKHVENMSWKSHFNSDRAYATCMGYYPYTIMFLKPDLLYTKHNINLFKIKYLNYL